MNGDPKLVLRLFPHAVRPGFRQTLAGLDVVSDAPLTPFAVPAAELAADDLPAAAGEPIEIYDGPGLLAGSTERIRAGRRDGRLYIRYADGETYEVSPAGARRTTARPASLAAGPISVERILGAPAALALAFHGRYLLHASALGRNDGAVVALVAESGGGKSTLAAAAARDPAAGWTRIADDQLAVRLGDAPAALPHVPQLKLSAEAQYPASAPASRPIAAVVAVGIAPEIAPSVEAAEGDIVRHPRVEPLSAADALSVLTAATVAARLFDRDLLAGHFAACAEAARRLPCFRLTAPRDLSRLDETLRALATAIP